MRHRKFLNLTISAGIAASCAGAAMMPPGDVPSTPAGGITLTPVTIDDDGRMAPEPERTIAVEPSHAARPARAVDTTSVTDPAPASHPAATFRPSPPEPPPPAAALPVAEREPVAEAEGEATYYASKFDGRRAASGVVFRNAEPYAAHRTYPFGTIVRVTSLVNDRSVVVRVIDRGPHGSSARARRTIIDLSQSAARELDFMRAGRIPVRIEVLEWGDGSR